MYVYLSFCYQSISICKVTFVDDCALTIGDEDLIEPIKDADLTPLCFFKEG